MVHKQRDDCALSTVQQYIYISFALRFNVYLKHYFKLITIITITHILKHINSHLRPHILNRNIIGNSRRLYFIIEAHVLCV